MQCKTAFPFFPCKGFNVFITKPKSNLNTRHRKHQHFIHRKTMTHLTAESLANITKLFCQDITDFREFINE